MHKYCIAMLLGAYTTALFSTLPGPYCLLPVLAAAMLLSWFAHLRLIAIYLAGFAMMGLAANAQLENRLDPDASGRDWVIVGQIKDFPDRRNASIRFVFLPDEPEAVPARIRLSWYEPEYLPAQGETWQLQVRLKRPRGLHNPGGFDYAGWLFRERIGATGYVIPGELNRRILTLHPNLIARARQRVADRIEDLFPDNSAAAVLMAIAIGARHKISRVDWDHYARTGTSHLMAISGLHIGLAAGSVYCLVWILLAPLFRTANLRDIALVCAAVAAGAYAQLSGFAVPAQRAFLMIFFTVTALMFRRRFDSGFLLAIPAIVIFLLEPLSILTPGFQLSFCAVAILFYCAATAYRSGIGTGLALNKRLFSALRSTAQMQLALLFGLFSLVMLSFDRFTPLAPFINALVLPLFNFVIVPLTLFGALLDGPFQNMGNLLLGWSYRSIRVVLRLVEESSTWSVSSFEITALGPVMVVVGLLPPLFSILPRSWPGRHLPLFAILAVVLYSPPRPDNRCFRYSVLDVGQGLAVVVETRQRTLIFDTGPAFRDGGDSGDSALLPFLARSGVRHVDRIVVSHGDMDHAGGLQSVKNGVDVGDIVVGEAIAGLRYGCQSGVQWRWDGVLFTFLHPRSPAAWDGNNRSCVLLIDNSEHRVLLTGDIEKPVEVLLGYLNQWPAVDTVVIPHHGSGTSSSATLVDAVQAKLAIVSAGHANRWGMPREAVVARWQDSGAKVLNTAHSGAVSQLFCPGKSSVAVRQERLRTARYWHDPPANIP